jgi:hypothetical protein
MSHLQLSLTVLVPVLIPYSFDLATLIDTNQLQPEEEELNKLQW